MAIQEQVRALVDADAVDAVVDALADDLAIDRGLIEVEVPPAGTYRDEAPDLELRDLVRDGRSWTPVAIAVGAAIGIAIALLVPALREMPLVMVPLFAFGGAWAATAVTAARRVQLTRREGPLPEQVHHVGSTHTTSLRLVTVRGLRDRGPVVDLLEDAGARLLDSSHPHVGEEEPGERPLDRQRDEHGPPLS